MLPLLLLPPAGAAGLMGASPAPCEPAPLLLLGGAPAAMPGAVARRPTGGCNGRIAPPPLLEEGGGTEDDVAARCAR
jgi:hypothetical protein